ncbi:DUF1287 domain-containing protein [Morganella morganii]|uniref:DUF1287 domain-containing protein n=1 Tax=Morganella TaxID=581 RepID=UPI000699B778|nr:MULTISPECIES: DUF1287 domain-containing protein [Morganella]HAE77972.1 DUF1287 domain-containing protein [Morganella sp. (in: enterobacteria)]EGT3624628.1 DUF1287 domain-containing protein [Morganella morganii]EGT3630645.1 DUF1287 domain-containing protein [Morganella morganii]EGT3634980.1 DUF1287 domain-containing protein [Morganella morganii]EKK5377068.1 DUF1287 domain-containing protein [Morganella morganii]
MRRYITWPGIVLLFAGIVPAGHSADSLSQAAQQLDRLVLYDPSYEKISYPGGDVSPRKGVCSDVVIRSYRKIGIDLQKEVHEDIKTAFSRYPGRKLWGQTRPDTNIDHRRVPNLMVFFSRKGESKPITQNAADYVAGDIVTWQLDNGRPHIGIVTDEIAPRSGNRLIMHNIGGGQVSEDVLFSWKITGHYRYKAG